MAAPLDLEAIKLKTECCGVSIAVDRRFCPKCGYEARVTQQTRPKSTWELRAEQAEAEISRLQGEIAALPRHVLADPNNHGLDDFWVKWDDLSAALRATRPHASDSSIQGVTATAPEEFYRPSVPNGEDSGHLTSPAPPSSALAPLVQQELRVRIENTVARPDDYGRGLHAAYEAALDLLNEPLLQSAAPPSSAGQEEP